MLIIASLLAAVIPMTVYLLIIWRMDSYEREPLRMVLLHFFWGAFGAVFFAILGSIFVSNQLQLFVDDQEQLSYFQTILVAPLVEEITKGLLLFLTVMSIKFDNLTDGLVYGGAIGLGFGMTENFLYFIAYTDSLNTWLAIVIIRSGFSAVMHCIATASFGAMLGVAKFTRGKKRYLLPLAGLLFAMFVHFMWNFSVSFENTFVFGMFFLLSIIVTYIVVFAISIRHERKIIFAELTEEAAGHLFPEAHLTIISSGKRKRKGWIPEEIRRKYIKAAIKLAFRKTEFKHSIGKKRELYSAEIEKYRSEIRALLNTSAVKL